MIPKVNVEEVSQGILGVLAAMSAALQQFGNATVAFFLEQVPERGEKLWLRFKEFGRQNEGGNFLDFIKSVVAANSAKTLYPKECTLDQFTRSLLASEVSKAIRQGIKTNDNVLEIYFGQGPIYEKARRISCRGCPITECRHHLKS